MTPERFEAGLIDRLQHQFPHRDLRWIADEIGVAKNPSAVLTHRAKQAERDDTHRIGQRPKAPAERNAWGFHPDGSLTDRGDHDRELTRFVRDLIAIRRSSDESPAEVAERIRAAGWEPAFGRLVAWDALADWRLWPAAHSGNSAMELVKRAGWSGVDSTWCTDCSRIQHRTDRCRCASATIEEHAHDEAASLF